SHFNGMWAFALWDSRLQKLFCARDRFGVKPFYYALHQGIFFFASEIKQILQAAALPRVADAKTCFQFLDRGLLDSSSDTFFENISQLPPAHYFLLEPARSLSPVIRSYWHLNTSGARAIQPQQGLEDSRAIAEFRSLFADAVRIRLRSDVPV